MSVYSSERPRGRLAVVVLLLVVIAAALLGGAYLLRPRFESQAPEIRLSSRFDVLGLAPVEIEITDQGTGLKSVTATLSSGGSEHALASEQYAQPVASRKITAALSKLAGAKEGAAVLRVTARDASLWNSFRGNETVLQKELTIDVTPPTLELIADDRYVNFGRVGAIVYKPSADTETSGVRIGERFFPGLKGAIKGQPDRYFALFAHPYA